MSRYITDRGIWILALLACVSVLLSAASGILGWQFYVGKRRAAAIVQRADSIHKDWVSRRCAPRSQALP